MSRLAGIEAKIDRASAQIAGLTVDWLEFAQRAYEVIPAPDLDGSGRRNFHLRIHEEAPLVFNVVVGEVVQHLRSALDYLLYQLLDINGAEVKASHYFPIANDETHFLKTYRSKVKGIGDRAEQVIKDLKPYRGDVDDYWILNELSRIEKHRLLLTVAIQGAALGLSLGDVLRSMHDAMPAEIRDSPLDIRAEELSRQYLMIPGARYPCAVLKDGDAVYSQPAEMDSYANTQLMFVLAFGPGEIVECEPVHDVLQRLVTVARTAVEASRPLLVS